MHDFSSARHGEFNSRRRSKRRFDDDEPVTAKRVRGRRALPPIEAFDATDGLPEGDRWSTWDQSIPTQRPGVPSGLAGHRPGRSRYRARHPEDRQGSRRLPAPTRRARRPVLPARRQAVPHRRAPDGPPRQRLPGGAPDQAVGGRAVASRSTFGRQAIVGQRAKAEFGALARLSAAGRLSLPPVQVLDTELLLEFTGAADGTAAPQPAETRPGGRQVGRAVGPAGAGTRRPGREGFAHGDPARVQPASARRPACDNRLPAGGRCDREPPRRVLPDPRRGEHGPLVRRPRPGRRAPGPGDLAALLRREAVFEILTCAGQVASTGM